MRIKIDEINRNFPITLETFVFIDNCKYAIITFGCECRYIGTGNYIALWWIIEMKENFISLDEIHKYIKTLREKYDTLHNIYINENKILGNYFTKLNLKHISYNIEEILPFTKGILRDERIKIPSEFKEKINNSLQIYTIENQNTLTNCLLLGLSKIKFQTLAPEDDIERRKILSELKEVDGIPSKYDSVRIIYC